VGKHNIDFLKFIKCLVYDVFNIRFLESIGFYGYRFVRKTAGQLGGFSGRGQFQVSTDNVGPILPAPVTKAVLPDKSNRVLSFII
jgi:hypothetical protein